MVCTLKSLMSKENLNKEEEFIYNNTENKTLLQLKKSADGGDLNSIYEYGMKLYKGEGIAIDCQTAAQYFKKSADKGHLQSIIMFCHMIIHKQAYTSVNISRKEMMKYLKIGADNNNTFCIYFYASYIGDKDKNEKIRYLKKGDELGDIKCTYSLGKELIYDKSLALYPEECAFYLEKAANKTKDGTEAFDYAMELQSGFHITQNEQKASKYFKLAADKGNIDAIREYYSCIKNERSMNKNSVEDKEFLKYMKIGAQNDLPECMYDYAMTLKNSKEYGLLFDDEEVKQYPELIKKAAEKNYGKAVFVYSLMLKNGDGFPVDKEKAAKLMKKAADNCVYRSYYEYYQMLKNGDGVKADQDEAMSYLMKGVNNFDPCSIYRYAVMLDSGIGGVEINKNDALKKYKNAATWGHPEAMFDYGVKCLTGNLLPIDRQEAAKYFKSAALRGHKEAEFNYQQLINCYSIRAEDDDVMFSDKYSLFNF